MSATSLDMFVHVLATHDTKLQVAAFAQLAVVGRGSNTCVYVIAIFTMCESTEKPQRKHTNYCSKHMVKMP